MPLYEVPIYVKVAAPSANEAEDYLRGEALDSLHTVGLRDCVRNPSDDRDGYLGWRAPNADELGVAGFVSGQPVRLATWRASRNVHMGEFPEPKSQRVNPPAL